MLDDKNVKQNYFSRNKTIFVNIILEQLLRQKRWMFRNGPEYDPHQYS